MKKDLRATWPQALGTLVAPVFVVFLIRWFLFEPFVIPSESMVPTLLVHDYIFANKLAYGLRVPFGNGFLWRWATPKRGDVLVFKYPLNLDVYYIKRAIGLPGDKIRLQAGVIFVNGTPLPTKPSTDVLEDSELESFHYFSESSSGGSSGYQVRYLDPDLAEYREISVPSGYLFMMGDNRDRSSDSRVWGLLPIQNVVGRASLVWLSCDETLVTEKMVCDPQTLRWRRMFKGIN